MPDVKSRACTNACSGARPPRGGACPTIFPASRCFSVVPPPISSREPPYRWTEAIRSRAKVRYTARCVIYASVRLFLLALVVSGCASVAPIDAALRRPAPPDLLRFGVDTFAFPNESRSKNRGKPDLYANYCFVMVRAVTQFQRFARFDASAPRVTADEYTRRVRRITTRAPWR